jgi:hypothetical protein
MSLDDLTRQGARRTIAVALEAEVAEWIERFAGQVAEDGHRLVVRNGPRPRAQVMAPSSARDPSGAAAAAPDGSSQRIANSSGSG